jgi:hypothetical protein
MFLSAFQSSKEKLWLSKKIDTDFDFADLVLVIPLKHISIKTRSPADIGKQPKILQEAQKY